MNRKGIISVLIIVLFFLNTFSITAQTVQKEKLSLTSILKALETLYNVRFSYVDETVKGITLELPESILTLTDALNYISQETHLDFKLLDDRFIVVSKEKAGNNTGFSTQQLEEVVVVNYLTSGLTKLNDGSITLKPESFGILPGLIEPDVLQTIQALPGILSVDETVSNINVRGGTHDQNLILWDGIKMYQSGHFFGLISAFNPYTTKSVNVSKNGTPAKYGDGISSIIDMQLSNTIDNQFNAGLGFNLINADGYAKIPLSHNTELQLSTRRSITDLINTATFEQYSKRIFQDSDFNDAKKNDDFISQNESFYFYDVTAKFLYDITKKDKVRFHFFNVFNDLNYDEQLTTNDRNEALNSKLTQRNSAIGMTYTRDWTNALLMTAQVYVSNYDLDATNHDLINNQRLIQENEVYDGSARLDIDYTHNQNFKFNTGYQFTEVGISNLEDVNNPNFRSYIKEVSRSHSVYGESTFLSNDAKTKLKFGTRLNYFNKFNSFLIEPRLSFSQRFLNHFRLEVLSELKSQTTSQIIDLQNDFLGIEKRRWVLSNNITEVTTNDGINIFPVPIIKSKQASVGLQYNQNKLLISAEGYIKKVDGITSRSQGFQNQYQFIFDTGSYKIKGVDVLINKQFNTIFSTWLSYTYSKNDYTFSSLNNGSPFPNNADIRHAMAFGGVYTHNDIKLALGINWHSGKPTTNPIDVTDNSTTREINYEAPNSSNLNDYLRTDFSASYAFDISNATKASIGASIWNVFNRKNIINTYYALNDDNTIRKVENQSLGITPNVSFRVIF
ncbi:TonB-dependent receptor plug domain-containing protein [Aestuariivivens insulae]|uniref:TonB-dependent receptor plug domain-containing protein n=1 Tax=Aestuariivivens insulae TaxID=1621988 RepID=UPI001F56BC67|nr:TonB-dependent receptor plug domain-containing protein [Aestuariivivens insulae]